MVALKVVQWAVMRVGLRVDVKADSSVIAKAATMVD